MRGAPAVAVILAVLAPACGRYDFAARDDAGAGDVAAPDTVVCPITEPTSTSFSAVETGPSRAFGSCGGADAPELVLPFEVPAGGATVVLAGDESDDDTVAYFDRTCAPAGTDIECDQDSGINAGAEIVRHLAAGSYYAFVDGQQPATQLDAKGQLVVELPVGAACPGAKPYWQCGPDTSCMMGSCVPTCGAISSTLQGSLTYSFTDSTIGQPSLHAGTCGDAGDGGRRGSERVYLLRLATAAASVEVSTSAPGTDYDTLVYLRDGCLGTELACDDDSGTLDNTSHFKVNSVAAGDYYLFVDGFSTRSGTFHIDIIITP